MKDIFYFGDETKGDSVKRKNYKLRKFFKVVSIIVLVLIGLSFIAFGIFKLQNRNRELNDIKSAWAEYDYQKVYELGKFYLQDHPYNNTALTYFSYASFFLSQAQTDTQQAQLYLDEAINGLRVALYSASSELAPQLQYMLGRAYFYKNTITTHYYSDLAVKYLLMAKENGYQADDIPEYLGLSYAALGMTMESISAFTEALLVRESDSLLLAIAEQYYNSGEYKAAEQYLFRIVNNSQNDEMILKSRILLGNIYIEQEKYDDAMKEFENVLKKDGNSADAHYGIGVIYEKQGDMVAARSEWRKTLKLQVNHEGALKKMYKD